MAKVTTRELHRRIGKARAEIGAMLWFLVPPEIGKGQKVRARRPREMRYLLDNQIRQLARLADSLATGDFDERTCGACGKALGPGQEVVHNDEDGQFHAECVGRDHGHCTIETRREKEADLKKRLIQARAYLKERGLSP